jgi:hypothetical protein
LGKTKDSRTILALIPPEASVAATNNLGPQLTHREKIIFLTNCLDNPNPWRVDMRRFFSLKPEYLVADLDPYADPNNFYPDGFLAVKKYLDDVQNLGEYQLVRKEGYVYLLKRK